MQVTFTGAGRDALDAAIARAPDHWVPLLWSVRDQGIGLTMIGQGREPFTVPTDRAHMVIIGDDLANALGPKGFHERSLRRYLPRCRYAAIVACEPLKQAYIMAVSPVVSLQFDTVLIETRPDREAEWAQFLDEVCPKAIRVHATTRPEGNA